MKMRRLVWLLISIWSLAVASTFVQREPRKAPAVEPEASTSQLDPQTEDTDSTRREQQTQLINYAAKALAGASPPLGDPLDPMRPREDQHFFAFADETRKRCEPESAGRGSTQELAAYARATAHCLQQLVDKQLRRLPREVQAQLAVGELIDESPDVWSPSWQRLLYAACGLEDHYQWHSGARRVAGSMRYISSAGCPSAPALEMGFWLHAMAQSDVDAALTRLQDTAPFGRTRLAALPSVIASAERMKQKAPEDSLFNEECWGCTLADMDWRRVLLRLHTFERETRRLGEAMCTAWPQLRDRLGADRCAAQMRNHLASILPSLPRPFETDEDAAVLRNEPPAKDANYARFIAPIIDACRANESLRFSNNAFEQRYATCMKERFDRASQNNAVSAPIAQSDARPRPLNANVDANAELLARWRSHTHALCGAEQSLIDAHLNVHDQRLMPYWSNSVRDMQCPALAYARGLYMLSALNDGDAASFARHVNSRLPWARRVRAGMSRARTYLRAAACTRDFEQQDTICRPRDLDQRAAVRLRGSLALLERTASRLAKTFCTRWPELARALGEPPACAGTMTSFYLSQAHFLGLVLPPGATP